MAMIKLTCKVALPLVMIFFLSACDFTLGCSDIGFDIGGSSSGIGNFDANGSCTVGTGSDSGSE